MSNPKIQIQLKVANQISETQSESSHTENKVKLTLKKKPAIKSPVDQDGFIDLKLYHQYHQKPTITLSGKSLIISNLSKLIDHIDKIIQASTGKEKERHQIRSSQFRKAITVIQAYPSEITSGADAQKLSGIGKGIASRIDEILKTGTLSELGESVTTDAKTAIIKDLDTVSGIGEAHAIKFMEMGVTSVSDLMNKAKLGQIKITHHMEVGLKYYHDFQKKIPYQEIADLGATMRSVIMTVNSDLMFEICGSHRRKKLMSGDIDVLVTNPKLVSDDDLIKSNVHYLKDIVKALTASGFIISDLTSHRDTKYMGVCMHPIAKIGRRVDIRFVPYQSFYPALLYFTGSMMTNKLMRTIALEKGYTLNEYGLYRYANGKKGEKIVVNSEKEVFDVLGIKYLTPTEREID